MKFTVDSRYNQTTFSFFTVVSSQQLFYGRFLRANSQESTTQPNTVFRLANVRPRWLGLASSTQPNKWIKLFFEDKKTIFQAMP
jgi:hypothetical protein